MLNDITKNNTLEFKQLQQIEKDLQKKLSITQKPAPAKQTSTGLIDLSKPTKTAADFDIKKDSNLSSGNNHIYGASRGSLHNPPPAQQTTNNNL